MARHDLDLLSLVSGLTLTGLGLLLLSGGPGASGLSLAWIGPLVAIGLAGIITLAAWPRRRPEPESEPDAAPENGR